MSIRGLRLLISVAVVFGFFMYFLSTQLNSLMPVKAPDEGQLGGPIPGLTKWQLAKFQEGRELFAKKFAVEEGLGPLYNASSCIQCHADPAITVGAASNASPEDTITVATESKGASTGLEDKDVRPGKLPGPNTKGGSAIKSGGKAGPGTTKDNVKTNDKGSGKNSADKSSNKTSGKTSEANGGKEPAKDVAATNLKAAEFKLEPCFPQLADRTIYMIQKRGVKVLSKREEKDPKKLDEKREFETAPISSLLSKTEFKDMDQMIKSGGPVLVRKTISDGTFSSVPNGCKQEPVKEIPKGVEFFSRRVAHQLYGLGFIDSLADSALNFHAARQHMDKNGPQGRAVHLQRTYFINAMFGRFGNKAQFSCLMNFVANELGLHLGISNPMFRHSISATGLDQDSPCMKGIAKKEPNDDGSLLLKVNFYLTTLAPPPRGPRNESVDRGEKLFEKMRCALCHIPEMRTPDKIMVFNPDGDPEAFSSLKEVPAFVPGEQGQIAVYSDPKCIELRALEKKVFHPYSDFLVHDMGPGLADGLAQSGSSGAEWKTTPLWGLRLRNAYLHDGRAGKLEDAISAHGGQGEASAKSFAKLKDSEKKDLLSFLNSL